MTNSCISFCPLHHIQYMNATCEILMGLNLKKCGKKVETEFDTANTDKQSATANL